MQFQILIGRIKINGAKIAGATKIASNLIPIHVPSTIPARKSLSMSVCDTMPYRIIARLGGKSNPRLPEEVNSPSVALTGY